MDHSESPLAGEKVRETFFAPARRASVATLAAQVAQVVHHPVVAAVLESFGGQLLVLNRERQILAASPEFREALSACGIDDFVGMRPGEALSCEHATEGPGGCGTSVACAHCGAVIAILAAQCCTGPASAECWIGMRRKNQRHSVEFRVKATPLVLDGIEIMVLALHDVSDTKRRRVLELSFLHDARNLLGGLITWSEVLQHERNEEAAVSIKTLALRLREQFSDYSVLAQAERGDLVATKTDLDLPKLARALGESLTRHPSGEGKNLVLRFPSAAPSVKSDQGLVLRVLSNMVANALEASPSGATVEVSYELVAGNPTFTVRNPGTIPEAIAPRIFQRSFSTKTQPGHGLGTYCMRLLGEQYLGGQVAFTSSVESGTAFTLTLPTA